MQQEGSTSPKILRSLYMTIDQVKRIKRLSDITRVPQAVIYREGIDLAIDKWEKIVQKGER